MTTPVSPLLRKARRLGLRGVESFVSLAVARGCGHYASPVSLPVGAPGRNKLSDEELTVLLLVGENRYEPMAIRCAAQLARSSHVSIPGLARMAKMEKVERVLAHIARAGLAHDPDGAGFWQDLLDRIVAPPERDEPDLPHWTRFVSMPGRQRHGEVPAVWLIPAHEST